MIAPERRITPRFKLQAAMSFHRSAPLASDIQRAKTINISTRGVFFATSLVLFVGEPVEVLLEMPKRVTGSKTGIRRFAGRVTHVEAENMPQGLSGIGVQLLYFEYDLVSTTINE